MDLETFKVCKETFDTFFSLAKGQPIEKSQVLKGIDKMYPKMAEHVKFHWDKLGGKWAVCQAVVSRDQRESIRNVLGSNVGKTLL